MASRHSVVGIIISGLVMRPFGNLGDASGAKAITFVHLPPDPHCSLPTASSNTCIHYRTSVYFTDTTPPHGSMTALSSNPLKRTLDAVALRLEDALPTQVPFTYTYPPWILTLAGTLAITYLVHYRDTKLYRVALWPIAFGSAWWALLTIDLGGCERLAHPSTATTVRGCVLGWDGC